MSTGVTYGGREQPMDIGRSNDNFKDEKLKCFNCNKYGYMVKECKAKKKKWETRKCFKYDKEEHIAKDYKGKQTMKNWKVQEELDNEDKKEKSFWDNLK